MSFTMEILRRAERLHGALWRVKPCKSERVREAGTDQWPESLVIKLEVKIHGPHRLLVQTEVMCGWGNGYGRVLFPILSPSCHTNVKTTPF